MKQKNPTLVALGHNVRRQREALSLSQEDLAGRADLDRTYIGGNNKPSFETITI